MTRALVTGAGGFVGVNVVRALLERGDDVHACVRSADDAWRLRGIERALHMHDFDITDPHSIEKILEASTPEIVYHLVHYGGNRGQSDTAMIERVIIGGTKTLYEACRRHGTLRIINAGSSSEYGLQQEAMREAMEPKPDTEYGKAKGAATLYGREFSRESGIPVTTLRLFSVYGPYEARTRFFPAVILALLRGEEPVLANPKTVRDFVHVDDVVTAFVQAATKPAGVYNVGTGIETTLSEAVAIIQSALGTSAALTWGGETGRSFDTDHWRADTSLTKKELGWEARIPLKEGVDETVAWFKAHRDLYE